MNPEQHKQRQIDEASFAIQCLRATGKTDMEITQELAHGEPDYAAGCIKAAFELIDRRAGALDEITELGQELDAALHVAGEAGE